MKIENNIKGFYGKYSFLSNFYYSPFIYEGIEFPTVEHAFQYLKTEDELWKQKILSAKTPGEAKQLGRKCPLVKWWEQRKLVIMKSLLTSKFVQNEDLEQRLLDTGDAYLEETNTWNDTYWGVCNGIGTNHLGTLLMQLREEIRQYI